MRQRISLVGLLGLLLVWGVAADAATSLFSQTFDANTTGTTTTCERSTLNPKRGTHSMRCNDVNVGGVEHQLDVSGINHSGNVIYMSWWYWMDSGFAFGNPDVADDHGHVWRWYSPEVDGEGNSLLELDTERYGKITPTGSPTVHDRPIMFIPGTGQNWDVDSANFSALDSTWHHYEALIDQGSNETSTGSLKYWVDGVLVVDESNRPMRWAGATVFGRWAVISNLGDTQSTYDFVDDVEIWDGCPGSGQLLGGLTPSCTAGPDGTPPALSAGNPSGVLGSGTTTTQVRLIATDATPPITCKYGASPGSTSTTDYASLPSTMTTTGCTSPSTHCANISGLTDNTSYTYYVRCQDSMTPTPNANTTSLAITFSVAATGSNPPTVPLNLAVVSHDDMTIALDWDVSTDPNGDLAGYRVFECHTSGSCTPNKFATAVAAPNASVNIVQLVPGTTYRFCVAAFDVLDNASACSNVVAQATTQVGIAASYPQDANIDSDGRVVWYEPFHGYANIAALVARYTDSNSTGNMSFQSDIPTNAPAGSQSVRFRNPVDDSTILYKEFPATAYTQLFLRYLIKYVTGHVYDGHSATWLQGYGPTLPGSPNPRASQCDIDGRFSGSFEMVNESYWNTYIYWPEMHAINGGACFGNAIRDNSLTVTRDLWHTVEVMIRLNTDVDGDFNTFDGEFAAWLDGTKVAHGGEGFPTGTWTFEVFTPGAGPGFEGFQWRKTTPVNSINNIWIQHFTQGNTSNSDLFFDQLVVSTAYVGPIVSGSGDTLAPSAPTQLEILMP